MTPRYNLRTLLILLAVLPPLLWIGWTEYSAWKAEQERLKSLDVWLESKAAPHPVAIDFASPTKPQPSVNAPLPVDAPLQEPRGR